MFGKLLYLLCCGRLCESQPVLAVMGGSQTAAHPNRANGLGSQGSEPTVSSLCSRGCPPVTPEKGRSFLCSHACRSAGVFPSLWARGGLCPEAGSFSAREWPSYGAAADCLSRSRSSARAGACPLALLLAARAHAINNSCGSFK